MAEFVRVPAEILAADTLQLPDSVDFEDATLIEPLACVVKAFRRGSLTAADSVVILGLGTMGALALRAARACGAEPVIGADRVPFRLSKARELGAHAVIDIDSEDLEDRVMEHTSSLGADVVLVTPARPDAIQSGLRLAGAGGRVLLFSPTPPSAQLALRPHDIYFKEVSLIPSYSCGPADTREALRLVASGRVRARDFVTHRVTLGRAHQAYALARDAGASLKIVVVV